MKKITSTSIIILIVTIIGFFIMYVPNEDGEYVWNPFDYARITEVDYKAVVVDEEGSYGKVNITERLTFDIHAVSQNNPFWELWRDLPETYIDGVKVEYNVLSVKQIFEDGSELVYQESPILYWYDHHYTNTRSFGPGKWFHSKGPYDELFRQYECLLFYIDGIYRDTVVFEIEYEMYNAALRYNDASELYLSMYSEDTIRHLTSFKGQVLFPNEIMPSSGNYYANTYGTNNHSFPFTESTSMNPGYHTFAFELNESQLQFKPYNQYIEFALVAFGDDKHIFTQHASINNYYNDDVLLELQQEQATYEALPSKWRNIKVFTLLLFSIATGLTIIYVLSIIKKITKKHTFYKPTMEIDYFRDIPSDLDSTFASELVFCKHKTSIKMEDAYAATMLSLVHKGYIALERVKSRSDWDPKNTKVVVKYNPTPEYLASANINQPLLIQPTKQHTSNNQETFSTMPPLTLTEEQYFKLILRHSKGKQVKLHALQLRISNDYEYTNTFIKNIKSSITKIGISDGYYQKIAYKKPKEQARHWVFAFWFIVSY